MPECRCPSAALRKGRESCSSQHCASREGLVLLADSHIQLLSCYNVSDEEQARHEEGRHEVTGSRLHLVG